MKGKDSMRKGLQLMLADPNLKLEFNAQRVEVAKSGDLAFSQGTYQLTVTDGKTKKPITDKGNYVTGYRKQADGSWKAVSDINVSELAPSGN
jgi:ketosteroid isomerase-like protein